MVVALVVLGCLAVGWAVGFGMGYRKGVNAGLMGVIFKPGHRVNAE